MKSSKSTEEAVKKSSKPKMSYPLFDFKAEVLKVFPEAEEEYRKAESVINRTRCTDCGRNNQHTRLLDVLSSLWNHRDISPLVPLLPEYIVGRIKGEYKAPVIEAFPPIPMPMPGMPQFDIHRRPPCLDCAHKHLAQALILLRESEQGYPEHVEYALEHLRVAQFDARDSVKPELARVASELAKFKKTGIQKGAGHLARAREILEDRLTRDEKLTRSLVIGHLSEAADECVNENPELARLIREERLNFMNQDSYDPPLALLISKIEDLNGHL